MIFVDAPLSDVFLSSSRPRINSTYRILPRILRGMYMVEARSVNNVKNTTKQQFSPLCGMLRRSRCVQFFFKHALF